MANKYLALQKDVFDINKVTVVGSPTITSDGVASGFSSGNYIKANISSLDLTDNFKLSFQIITSSDVTTEQSVWGTTCNNQAFVYQIYNGVFRLYYPTGTGQRGIIDFGEVEANKTYNITLSCKNGTLTIQDYNKSFSFLGSTITFLYMGSGRFENTTMFKGSIDLPSFKVTTNNTTFSPTKLAYLLERRKPKVWNKGQFTIVGSPSISDDGIASGFSTNNLLQIPVIQLGNYDNWEIVTPKFTFSEFTTTNMVIFWAEYNTWYGGIRLLRSSTNGRLSIILASTSNTDNDIGTIIIDTVPSLNVEYQIKLKFTGTQYIAYLKVGDSDWQQEGTPITTTTKVYNALTTMVIGNYQNNGTWTFKGSMNLKYFKIYTDNTLVFDGGAETYVYDPSKFTIVGSPTITEYGVASGFSSTSYLQVQKFSLGGTSWSIKANIIPVANPNDSRWQTIFCDQIVEKQLSFFVNSSGTRLGVWIRSADDTGTLYSNSYFGNIINDKLQEVELRYENKTLSSYADGDKKASYSIDLDDRIFNNNKIVGFAYGGQIFYGSIDLPSTSITADGKEIFTGAKEQFYMLNGV